MLPLNIDLLAKELKQKHHCHTIILYGSYADNTHNENSDIDIICIGSNVLKATDSRYIDGVFLDAWVYPEESLENFEDFLQLANGKVLIEEDNYGTLLLAQINSISDELFVEPEEINHLKVWCEKMLKRAELGDIEGNYRKNWLAQDLLSIYFNIRGIRYKGSKKSFQYLKENDYLTYMLFEEIYKNINDLSLLRKLVDSVFQLEPNSQD